MRVPNTTLSWQNCRACDCWHPIGTRHLSPHEMGEFATLRRLQGPIGGRSFKRFYLHLDNSIPTAKRLEIIRETEAAILNPTPPGGVDKTL